MATIKARRRRIRDGATRSNEPKRRILQFLLRQRSKHSSEEGAERTSEPVREGCRGRGENSKASIVGSSGHGGFIAAIQPATIEIFSEKFRVRRPIDRL